MDLNCAKTGPNSPPNFVYIIRYMFKLTKNHSLMQQNYVAPRSILAQTSLIRPDASMNQLKLLCMSWIKVRSSSCEVPDVVVNMIHPGEFIPKGHF